MIEALASTLNALKEARPKLMVTLCIATACLLFLPDDWLLKVGLSNLAVEHTQWIGLVFLISGAWIATDLLETVFAAIKRMRANRKLKRDLKQSIRELTYAERQYLAPYIVNRENTYYFALDDGVAAGLEAKGFLYRSANSGSLLHGFAYNLQPWARRELVYRRDLFEDIECLPPTPSQRLLYRRP